MYHFAFIVTSFHCQFDGICLISTHKSLHLEIIPVFSESVLANATLLRMCLAKGDRGPNVDDFLSFRHYSFVPFHITCFNLSFEVIRHSSPGLVLRFLDATSATQLPLSYFNLFLSFMLYIY